MEKRIVVSVSGCVFALLAFACAHVPGKWESQALKLGAPPPIVAGAEGCDAGGLGDLMKCLDYASWIGGRDPMQAAEVYMLICNAGIAPGCTAAEQLKRMVEMRSTSESPPQ